MKFTHCLAIATLFLSASVWSKSIDNTDKVEQVSDQFMTQVTQGDAESALSLIGAYLGVDTASFEQRASKIVNDMKRIETSAGKALSFAKIDTRRVGEHFYQVRYLLKFRQAALVWELNYYQPDAGWQLVDVSFNTDIDSLFE